MLARRQLSNAAGGIGRARCCVLPGPLNVALCQGVYTQYPYWMRPATAVLLAILSAASSQERLISTWEGGLAERVEELVRDGEEAAVLEPLSRYPARG